MTQQTDDSMIVRELAERLLAARQLFLTQDARRIALSAGALPAGLPLDLPLPPGTRIVGGMTQPAPARPGAGTGDTTQIVLDVPGSAADVFAFFEQAMTVLGWSRRENDQMPRPGGFQAVTMPPSRGFCRGPGGPFLSIRVLGTAADVSDVHVHVDTSNPGPCGAAARGPALGFNLLPQLSGPPNTLLHFLSAGGGSGGFSSTALAMTDRPAAELEAHFGRQFEAAGWVRGESGVNGPLAWSTWTSKEQEGRQAVLMVVEEAVPGRRLLHARVELAGGGPPGGTGWVGSASWHVSGGIRPLT